MTEIIKKVLLIIIIPLLFMTTESAKAEDHVIHNLYGDESANTLRSIARLPNGGYVAVGSTGSYSAHSRDKRDGWIVICNEFGEITEHVLGSDKADALNSVIITKEGLIIAVGYSEGEMDGTTNNGGTDAWVVEIDGTGIITSTLFGGASSDTFNDVAQKPNGDIVFVGSTYGSFPSQVNNGQSDGYIVIESTDGHVNTLVIGRSKFDSLKAVAVTASSKIIAVGESTNSLTNYAEGIIIELDANLQSTTKYKNNKRTQFFTDISIKGEEYVAVGSAYDTTNLDHGWILRVDEHGIESNEYIKTSGLSYLTSVSTNDLGGYVVTGYGTGYYPGNTSYGAIDGLVLRINNNWEISKEQYGGAFDDILLGSVEVDTGHVFVGQTSSTIGAETPKGDIDGWIMSNMNQDITVSFSSNIDITIPSKTLSKGGKIKIPNISLNSNYVFNGWYTDNTYVTKFDFTKPITSDTIIYAKFDKNKYTINFLVDDVDIGQNQLIPYLDLIRKPNITLTKPNHIFDGWYTDNTYTTKFDFSKPVTANIVLYGTFILKDNSGTSTKGENNTFMINKVTNSGISPITGDTREAMTLSMILFVSGGLLLFSKKTIKR